MSSLSEKLAELDEPKWALSLYEWFKSLSPEDFKLVWTALRNPNMKTYTIYGVFREEGLRCSKDTFVRFRNAVLAGKAEESEFNVSK